MHDVMTQMVQRGLARSARDLSTTWLGRAANYLCDRDGRISAEAALRLYLRLRERGHTDLAASVWQHIVRDFRAQDAA